METATVERDRPALDGLLVADFSRVLAGPLATMMLADLGATVIKVERPGTGDDTRHWGPPWTSHSSAYYESVNRSKQSVALDLTDPDDLAQAKELALRADVLVENFKSGSLDRLGLGYDDLAVANPRLVYCSITGFGSGAGADIPGYDFVAQAVGGIMSLTGEPDGDPLKVGVAVVDVLTGKDATIGILAALQERERSGRGQRIEVNLLHSCLAALVNQSSSTLTTGVSPERKGNGHPSIAPYETLRCRDGSIALACGNDRQYAALCGVLGIEVEERFATNPQRAQARGALRTELEAVLANEDVQTWVKRLNRVGVPAGPINDIATAIQLADDLGLSPTVDLGPDHPAQISLPITLSRSPSPKATPPPDLGEHTLRETSPLPSADVE